MLPERYLGAESGFDATYHIRLGDIGNTWEVRWHHRRRPRPVGRNRPGCLRRVVGTNADTWLRLRRGSSPASRCSRSGCCTPAATSTSRSASRMFRLPDGCPPLVLIDDVALERGGRVWRSYDGRGSRRAPAARPRRHQDLGPSTRRRSAAATASTRWTCRGFRRLQQARAGQEQRGLLRPRHARGDGRAGDRARAPDRQLDGWPRRAQGRAVRAREGRRPGRCGAGVAFVRRSYAPIVRLLRPASACSPTGWAAAGSRASSGRCSPTATSSTRAWPTSPSTSSSASTARRARASPSWPAPARSTSTRRSAAAACSRGSRHSSRPRCSSGARTTS